MIPANDYFVPEIHGMKRRTEILFYCVSFAVLTSVAWLIFNSGKQMEHLPQQSLPSPAVGSAQLSGIVIDALHHPVAIFILQLILIIAASQLCAWLFKKIGQPAVMGEIIAGILLGPSLMGSLVPSFSAFVFPVASLGNIQMLSQVGLILFMFVIGMELDMDVLKKRAGAALFISYFSIIIPFGLGITLSYFLYPLYAPANIPFLAFTLFMGIAMSITAFPVLARIIRERGLTGTKVGVTAITAAAAGDVAAWCLLAAIIAIVKAGSVSSALYTLIPALVYILAMLFLFRPLLTRLAQKQSSNAVMKRSVMAVVFVVLLLSAYCCEVIGIHALFGAFLAGIIMPRGLGFRTALIGKIEDVALVLLLPLFFVATGLRTEIGLLNTTSLWITCGWITLLAVAGKFGGSTLAARITGETLKDSLAIGALMNTRGLVELVVLNIGYDLHILSPQVFTMMVFMALATTFMTNPALNLISGMKEK